MYFAIFGKSNQRIYQYDEGAVKVRPTVFPLASNVSLSVFSKRT
jgi:hypothetical protein